MHKNQNGFFMRNIRRTKIQVRLFITFLILSLVPVLFIGIYAYNTYTESINTKLGAAAEQNARLLNATLNTELERYIFYINSLSVLDTVQNMLSVSGAEPSVPNVEDILAINQMITDTTIQSAYLRNIRIADRNGNVVYDYPYDNVDNDQYLNLVQQAEQASPYDALYYVKTFRSVNNLVLGRKIYRYASANEHIGYVFVYVNEKMLSDTIYPGISYGDDSDIMLVNKDGLVLSATDTTLLGNSIAQDEMFLQMQQAHAEGKSSFDGAFHGKTALVVFSYSDRFDSYFVATVPSAYIAAETRQIANRLVLVAAVLIALSFLVTLLVYFSIMQPISTIISRCNVVADDDLDRDINDKSPDELGFLARTIDRIISELKGMAHEWQQDQLRKRELELEMLQYQINPHFLFNTLNTLRWIAVINEVPVLDEGISSLSALLQSTLIRTEEFIPIREEITNLQHYFSIQRIRYGDSFEAIYQLDNALLSHRIPRFVLQPIAENSILHGMPGNSRKINITVQCFKAENGDVVIALADDGVGFEASDCLPVGEQFSGIGLKNVDERLRLYFGAEYGLSIASATNAGTVCRIVVPHGWLEQEGNL